MKKVMITGFGPFLNNSENPSGMICDAVNSLDIGIELVGVKLPVTFNEAPQVLLSAIERERPCAVISLGLAADRAQIEIEKVALNFRHCQSPDNNGTLATNEVISDHGPAAYMTSLPHQAIIERLAKEGVSARLSLSAGSYVCNEVFYRLMEYASAKNIQAGFIHLPNNSTSLFLGALSHILEVMEEHS